MDRKCKATNKYELSEYDILAWFQKRTQVTGGHWLSFNSRYSVRRDM